MSIQRLSLDLIQFLMEFSTLEDQRTSKSIARIYSEACSFVIRNKKEVLSLADIPSHYHERRRQHLMDYAASRCMKMKIISADIRLPCQHTAKFLNSCRALTSIGRLRLKSHELQFINNPSPAVVHIGISVTPNLTSYSTLSAFINTCSNLRSLSLSLFDEYICTFLSRVQLSTCKRNQIRELLFDNAFFGTRQVQYGLHEIFPNLQSVAFANTCRLQSSGRFVSAVRGIMPKLKTLALHITDSSPIPMNVLKQVCAIQTLPERIIVVLKDIREVHATSRSLFKLLCSCLPPVEIQIEHSCRAGVPASLCQCAVTETRNAVLYEYMSLKKNASGQELLNITIVESFEAFWLNTVVFRL